MSSASEWNTPMDLRKQVVAGLVPPLMGEAIIRETWPSVAAYPGLASLGRTLMCSWIGAPLAWMLLLPVYFSKILPFVARRYTLTNQRLMIQRGLKPQPTHEIPLSKIDDVRVNKDVNSAFFRSGNLDVISDGKVVLTLLGLSGPEAFRHTVLDACKAWVPGRASAPIISAKASEPAAH